MYISVYNKHLATVASNRSAAWERKAKRMMGNSPKKGDFFPFKNKKDLGFLIY